MRIEQHANWSWADFIKRFKAKRLGFKDIDPLWIRVDLPYLLVSWTGLLLIDSESDWLRSTSAMLIAIIFIIFLIVLYGTLSAHAKWPRDSLASTVWMIAWPPILGVIYALLGAGYILWINALIGEQNKTILTGAVIEKGVGGGRYTGKDYFLTIKSDNRPVRLAVTADDYTNYSVGSLYSREMIHGGLGIYYSWGIGIWK